MELVKLENDKVVTELKTVSKYFNKVHYDLYKSVNKLIIQAPELVTEFIHTKYTTDRGKTHNTYLLTQKAFSILVMGFTGSKALKWKIKFYDAFEKLRNENKMLIELLNQAISDGKISERNIPADMISVLHKIENLRNENKMLIEHNYITHNTYCISDISKKFKDLTPPQAQHELYMHDWLEYRKNGLFPTEFYDKNNDIISVLDENRNRYYPRYTINGVIKVEEFLRSLGYKLKGEVV